MSVDRSRERTFAPKPTFRGTCGGALEVVASMCVHKHDRSWVRQLTTVRRETPSVWATSC
jgi:hypothetical protein